MSDFLSTFLPNLLSFAGGGGLVGFVSLKYEQKKSKAEAEKVQTAADHDRLDLHQDQYDYVNAQLSKIQQEYYDLASRYRETMTAHLLEIDAKCNEIAELKSKLTYFKGLRCYQSDCPSRVKESPYRDHAKGDDK